MASNVAKNKCGNSNKNVHAISCEMRIHTVNISYEMHCFLQSFSIWHHGSEHFCSRSVYKLVAKNIVAKQTQQNMNLIQIIPKMDCEANSNVFYTHQFTVIRCKRSNNNNCMRDTDCTATWVAKRNRFISYVLIHGLKTLVKGNQFWLLKALTWWFVLRVVQRQSFI